MMTQRSARDWGRRRRKSQRDREGARCDPERLGRRHTEEMAFPRDGEEEHSLQRRETVSLSSIEKRPGGSPKDGAGAPEKELPSLDIEKNYTLSCAKRMSLSPLYREEARWLPKSMRRHPKEEIPFPRSRSDRHSVPRYDNESRSPI